MTWESTPPSSLEKILYYGIAGVPRRTLPRLPRRRASEVDEYGTQRSKFRQLVVVKAFTPDSVLGFEPSPGYLAGASG